VVLANLYHPAVLVYPVVPVNPEDQYPPVDLALLEHLLHLEVPERRSVPEYLAGLVRRLLLEDRYLLVDLEDPEDPVSLAVRSLLALPAYPWPLEHQ
jgi:hypothetical protein